MQTMHLLPGVTIQPNLELKTRPKPVLGSLPLAFALPGLTEHKLTSGQSNSIEVEQSAHNNKT